MGSRNLKTTRPMLGAPSKFAGSGPPVKGLLFAGAGSYHDNHGLIAYGCGSNY
jgi:hypothetical protein